MEELRPFLEYGIAVGVLVYFMFHNSKALDRINGVLEKNTTAINLSSRAMILLTARTGGGKNEPLDEACKDLMREIDNELVKKTVV